MNRLRTTQYRGNVILKRTALTVVDAGGELVRPGLPKRGSGILDKGVRTYRGAGSLAVQPIPNIVVSFTAEENERFLRIVAGARTVARHYELFLFTQGELQHFVPHQVLIAAWGDFARSNLTLDVVSAIPRVRTGLLNGGCVNIVKVLTQLYLSWVAGGRQPMLLSNRMRQCRNCCKSDCALHDAANGMRSMLVHGIGNARDGIESLYLALNSGSIANGYNRKRFHVMVDALVSQIDIAFRNVVGLPSARITAAGYPQARRGDLSVREVQLMVCVAEGRTNQGIAAILGISPNTVKNHVKRVFAKLGATNRTEAVAKCR